METFCTEHAEKRRAQRNLTSEELDIILTYGQCYYRTGAVFYFLGRDDLPPDLQKNDRYAKLEGTTLITTLNGDIITAYRNRQAAHAIRKKSKRRLRRWAYGRQLGGVA